MGRQEYRKDRRRTSKDTLISDSEFNFTIDAETPVRPFNRGYFSAGILHQAGTVRAVTKSEIMSQLMQYHIFQAVAEGLFIGFISFQPVKRNDGSASGTIAVTEYTPVVLSVQPH